MLLTPRRRFRVCEKTVERRKGKAPVAEEPEWTRCLQALLTPSLRFGLRPAQRGNRVAQQVFHKLSVVVYQFIGQAGLATGSEVGQEFPEYIG